MFKVQFYHQVQSAWLHIVSTIPGFLAPRHTINLFGTLKNGSSIIGLSRKRVHIGTSLEQLFHNLDINPSDTLVKWSPAIRVVPP